MEDYAPGQSRAALLDGDNPKASGLTEGGGKMSEATLSRLIRGQSARMERPVAEWVRALGAAVGMEGEFREALSLPAHDQREEAYRREVVAKVERARAELPLGLATDPLLVQALRSLREHYQPKRDSGGRKERASDSALLLAELRLYWPLVLAGSYWATQVERQWWELSEGEKKSYLKSWRVQQDIWLQRPGDRAQIERFPPDPSEATGWPYPQKKGGWQRSAPRDWGG